MIERVGATQYLTLFIPLLLLFSCNLPLCRIPLFFSLLLPFLLYSFPYYPIATFLLLLYSFPYFPIATFLLLYSFPYYPIATFLLRYSFPYYPFATFLLLYSFVYKYHNVSSCCYLSPPTITLHTPFFILLVIPFSCYTPLCKNTFLYPSFITGTFLLLLYLLLSIFSYCYLYTAILLCEKIPFFIPLLLSFSCYIPFFILVLLPFSCYTPL